MRPAALSLLVWLGGVAVLVLLQPAHAHAAGETVQAVVNQLATQFMCQCGCGLTLASCTHPVCGPRDRMLAEIRRLVEAGKTPAEITDVLVAQYGEAVLAAPPRRGLNLVAWWGPYAALLAGAVVILLLGASWTRRPAPQAAPPSSLTPEERRLLDEELRKFDV
ncbi:MAG: cytochrome c-type biogenesis protein CcmH [Armatimonadota bacterium]|nr:cytochrome c-type biogenesis protein CcmH [Armatimonadota bacterium]MDR7426566.1 cytochrome c-type biogenesis protein CcmH [Armatimonadota bacterium]MDR7463359.1 cytochrome c-type biogenesis protein CcmH [Armatimonadota bacterium]MDR7468586.1 cytochrome c-type biogenesis protein CcmH [Armatimonadota bacterium]MDR7475179.1 cytochrome c-type biogenesis protein CcmH [Armatimonadota bacterium]